jgi:tRNA A37 N6-isopentenylltransferase MiaA
VDNRPISRRCHRCLRYHATMQERFPYEECQWHQNEPERQKRWYEVLERTGPENVRARLAQTNAGSPGAISIGTEQSLTIGFAQEWLAWHDRKKG